MTISKAEPVRITRRPNSEEKRSASFKDTIRRCHTLKELQEKNYPFHDLDLAGMLDLAELLTPNTVDIIEWSLSSKKVHHDHGTHHVVGQR